MKITKQTIEFFYLGKPFHSEDYNRPWSCLRVYTEANLICIMSSKQNIVPLKVEQQKEESDVNLGVLCKVKFPQVL